MKMPLHEYIAQAPAQFDWATNNCGHFVSRWVAVRGMRDFMKDLHTPDLRRALRAIMAEGSPESTMSKLLGVASAPATMATSGDVVYLQLPDGGNAYGICCGRLSAFLGDTGSIHMVDTLHARCSWRVQ